MDNELHESNMLNSHNPVQLVECLYARYSLDSWLITPVVSCKRGIMQRSRPGCKFTDEQFLLYQNAAHYRPSSWLTVAAGTVDCNSFES